ncbi:unnamed protein product, partial [Discosporangium mesarthrocarpum]
EGFSSSSQRGRGRSWSATAGLGVGKARGRSTTPVRGAQSSAILVGSAPGLLLNSRRLAWVLQPLLPDLGSKGHRRKGLWVGVRSPSRGSRSMETDEDAGNPSVTPSLCLAVPPSSSETGGGGGGSMDVCVGEGSGDCEGGWWRRHEAATALEAAPGAGSGPGAGGAAGTATGAMDLRAGMGSIEEEAAAMKWSKLLR